MWYEWFFNGLGTAIITFILGLFLGSISGYKIGKKNKGNQIQSASNNAKQEQAIEIEPSNGKLIDGLENVSINQKQKARDNAEQRQIGRIKRCN